jgi:hypothetical protein
VIRIATDIHRGWWQVEGVDAMCRRCRQSHYLAICCFGNTAVLVLRVHGDAVGAVDQLPQHQQFSHEALPGAGGGNDDQVGVIQRPVERIEHDGCLGRAIQADEHAALHRQGWPNERERGRQRAGVHVARHHELVASFGQATPKAALLFP